MNISVIGTGYVGLVTGAGLADKGYNVICYDIVRDKINDIERGVSPIYEKGLERIIKRNIGKRLTTTLDLKFAIMNSKITFICVGTPSNKDGSINLRYIKDACRGIGNILKEKKEYHLIVVKSTVVPGTTEDVIIPELENASGKKAHRDFGVVMSPEFLREGVAVEDFLNPDRVIIGANDKGAGDLLADIYSKFNCPILRVNIKTAEMIKYASNAFLATKISYINEIGNICKNLGIDVYDVAKGMSLDHRISKYFLNAGLGFGGSCLPKDLRALIHKSKGMGYEPLLLESVIKVNEYQPRRMLEIAKNKIGSFKGKNVAILGAAFKAETDDIRESPAIYIIDSLLREDAIITLYDPKANNNMKRIYKERIRYAETAKEALKNADLALIITDWKEFELLDFSDMRERIVIDGRRIIKRKIKKIKDRGKEEEDIEYEGLCW